MSSWTEQMGFPMLRVSKVDTETLSVTQQWFLANGSGKSETRRWTVPIFVATHEEPAPRQMGVYTAAEGDAPFAVTVKVRRHFITVTF